MTARLFHPSPTHALVAVLYISRSSLKCIWQSRWAGYTSMVSDGRGGGMVNLWGGEGTREQVTARKGKKVARKSGG
jgi:hypothetical protein